MDEITQEHIGKCVRVGMAAQNIKQKDLAARLGKSPASIRLYCKGNLFDVRLIWEVAQELGFDSLDKFLAIK